MQTKGEAGDTQKRFHCNKKLHNVCTVSWDTYRWQAAKLWSKPVIQKNVCADKGVDNGYGLDSEPWHQLHVHDHKSLSRSFIFWFELYCFPITAHDKRNAWNSIPSIHNIGHNFRYCQLIQSSEFHVNDDINSVPHTWMNGHSPCWLQVCLPATHLCMTGVAIFSLKFTHLTNKMACFQRLQLAHSPKTVCSPFMLMGSPS